MQKICICFRVKELHGSLKLNYLNIFVSVIQSIHLFTNITYVFVIAYLADSGTVNGANMTKSIGTDVAIANNLQLLIQKAIQGKTQAPKVKNIAIDMLATNVLHEGPTYSKTKKKQIINIVH